MDKTLKSWKGFKLHHSHLDFSFIIPIFETEFRRRIEEEKQRLLKNIQKRKDRYQKMIEENEKKWRDYKSPLRLPGIKATPVKRGKKIISN